MLKCRNCGSIGHFTHACPDKAAAPGPAPAPAPANLAQPPQNNFGGAGGGGGRGGGGAGGGRGGNFDAYPSAFGSTHQKKGGGFQDEGGPGLPGGMGAPAAPQGAPGRGGGRGGAYVPPSSRFGSGGGGRGAVLTPPVGGGTRIYRGVIPFKEHKGDFAYLLCPATGSLNTAGFSPPRGVPVQSFPEILHWQEYNIRDGFVAAKNNIGLDRLQEADLDFASCPDVPKISIEGRCPFLEIYDEGNKMYHQYQVGYVQVPDEEWTPQPRCKWFEYQQALLVMPPCLQKLLTQVHELLGGDKSAGAGALPKEPNAGLMAFTEIGEEFGFYIQPGPDGVGWEVPTCNLTGTLSPLEIGKMAFFQSKHHSYPRSLELEFPPGPHIISQETNSTFVLAYVPVDEADLQTPLEKGGQWVKKEEAIRLLPPEMEMCIHQSVKVLFGEE